MREACISKRTSTTPVSSGWIRIVSFFNNICDGSRDVIKHLVLKKAVRFGRQLSLDTMESNGFAGSVTHVPAK